MSQGTASMRHAAGDADMDEEGELVVLCLGSQYMLLAVMHRELHSESVVCCEKIDGSAAGGEGKKVRA
jgi:hypothetical protein